ncbi:lipase 3-like isoform X2 [Venturia canescens]|uniref:lipase 3-like isoform X2 n=1 Tax=Venturia canescens TaxID=32260 RepID=UPI001C9D385B|nr:lipase 3-like isoform X2 [Venturia canescens]
MRRESVYIVGLVEKHGYPSEEHEVTTEDGYNIKFFRIPGSPKSMVKRGKPVVFMQHGMFASSDSWVLLGPNRDLAFLLADIGYDVWLGNVRGNSYGRSHVEVSPEEPEFWNFSFHEIAVWDLPKMIEHTLNYTDQKSLCYIGHSMGTTAGFILLAQRPEFNNKIHFFIALAPVALWKRPPNPLVEAATINGVGIKAFFDRHGIHELAPQSSQIVRIGRTFCDEKSATLPACARLFFLFGGEDPQQLNVTLLSHIVSYIPAGISTKTLFHFRQNIISGNFQHYDAGYIENFKLYGKKKPPIYDLRRISVPIALIYGHNDALSREENTIELARRLSNVVTIEAVPFRSFNHFDFLWAIDAKELLYDRVMTLIALFAVYR